MKYVSHALAALLLACGLTLPAARAQLSARSEAGVYGLLPSGKTAPDAFFAAHAKQLGTTARTTWAAHGLRRAPDRRGMRHDRYAQLIDGVPVRAATVVLHSRDGLVLRATGRSYRDAEVTSDAAESPAQAGMRARQVLRKREKTGTLPYPAARYAIQTPELVLIDRAYPSYSGALALAYEVHAATAQGRDARLLYLDATRGQLLADIPLVHHRQVPGSVETSYYGQQDVAVDSVGAADFRLRDTDRGISVNSELTGTEIRSATRDFAADPDAARSTMGGDVYYGTVAFYDLMESTFGWRGVDGQGEPMVAHVADIEGERFVNAYWNGREATFGGGDCHYQPLTTLDVVGHEFMHGITQRTSNLVYAGESGALNEGYSDIFGKALEYLEQPDQFTWSLGNRFADSRYARAFRSMADPTQYFNPKMYGGEYWYDYGGVHTNSGPLGHWFYLLVEGGRGQNEAGTTYDVAPVPMLEALELAFETTRDYLTEGSTYLDAYESSLLVAADRYGANSPELANLQQAWAAIGMPAGANGTDDVDLAFASLSPGLETVCFRDGQVTLQLRMINRGTALPAGTAIDVTARSGGASDTQTITLDYPLQPSNWAFEYAVFDLGLAPGAHDLELTLAVAGDVNPDNDVAVQPIDYRTGAHDFVLVYADWPFTTACGAPDVLTATLSYGNDGCDDYDGALTAEFYDSGGQLLEAVSTPVSVAGGERELLSVEVARATADAVRSIRLVAPGDADVDDNEDLRPGGTMRALTPGVVLDFESSAAGYGLRGEPFDAGLIGEIEFGGSRVFALTGSFRGGPPCETVEGNFGGRYTNPPVTCVDLSGEANPVLAFDLMHRHGAGDPDFPELDALGRALRVTWRTAAGAEESVVIGSQPDGEWTQHTVALPADFVGEIAFDAYNASGSRYTYDNGGDDDLTRYDYALLDNITVRSPVATEEERARKLTVAPNPADAVLELRANSTEPAGLRVVSALGRVVYAATLRGAATLDTSAWPAGSYVVLLDGPTREVHRVVVVH